MTQIQQWRTNLTYDAEPEMVSYILLKVSSMFEIHFVKWILLIEAYHTHVNHFGPDPDLKPLHIDQLNWTRLTNKLNTH